MERTYSVEAAVRVAVGLNHDGRVGTFLEAKALGEAGEGANAEVLGSALVERWNEHSVIVGARGVVANGDEDLNVD